MIHLGQALRAWGTPGFQDALKRQIAQCAGQLPLQNGLLSGSLALECCLELLYPPL